MNLKDRLRRRPTPRSDEPDEASELLEHLAAKTRVAAVRRYNRPWRRLWRWLARVLAGRP